MKGQGQASSIFASSTKVSRLTQAMKELFHSTSGESGSVGANHASQPKITSVRQSQDRQFEKKCELSLLVINVLISEGWHCPFLGRHPLPQETYKET